MSAAVSGVLAFFTPRRQHNGRRNDDVPYLRSGYQLVSKPHARPRSDGRGARRVGATRVWLCSARGIEGETRLAEEERLLIENRAFFEQSGLEVGVWICSLGHGGALIQDDPDALRNAGKYRRMVGMNGTTCDDTFCPSDEAFVRDYADWVGRIAATARS